MINNSDFLDDIARVAGGAAGIANSASQQIRNDIKARIQEVADRMNLVPREDFERVESLLIKVMAEQEELKKRIETLDGSTKTEKAKAKKA